MFNKDDIVVAKDGYLDKGETLKDTAGVVIDHNPENDRLTTEQERLDWCSA